MKKMKRCDQSNQQKCHNWSWNRPEDVCPSSEVPPYRTPAHRSALHRTLARCPQTWIGMPVIHNFVANDITQAIQCNHQKQHVLLNALIIQMFTWSQWRKACSQFYRCRQVARRPAARDLLLLSLSLSLSSWLLSMLSRCKDTCHKILPIILDISLSSATSDKHQCFVYGK